MESTNKRDVRQVDEHPGSLPACSAVDLLIAADAVEKALVRLSDDDALEVGRIVMGRRAAADERRTAAFAKCESPIEEGLLRALLACGFDVQHGSAAAIAYNPVGVSLYAQRLVSGLGKPCRLDFSVEGSTANGEQIRVAIECDGHDFHERTKEQARNDRSRDRALTLAGWTVLRFTGSEIHQDAIRCASDVIRAAKCDTPRGAPKLSVRELAARATKAMAFWGERPKF